MKSIKLVLLASMLVTLTGCAGLFIAGAATTANMVTDPRSTKEIWQDNNLELEVAGLANKEPYRKETRISAVAYRGTVVLLGQSSTEATLEQFIAQARQLKDVKELHNQIQIKAPLSVGEISNDSWITTKVKSALLTKSELNGIKVKVVTEDRVVYLFGYVSAEHADIAIEVARNIIGVKQVVRAFDYAQ
ncbi:MULTISPECIES: BON domain-containing protein [Vibrio]|uniref:BON domain-containing protein n=1 Tax=Vibrio chanodichtyis TaxID=3027932 RepID=A0ABT5UZA9_9VIBR|nr:MULTISPECIES: BON domain-containing protein [Vibrio]MDE1514745.1 BON domain-containing protein [Vibrio chanodichtyis]